MNDTKLGCVTPPCQSSQIMRTSSPVISVEERTTNYLENNGYVNIDIVYDGIEAIKMEEKNEYDLILMDCQMPKMNGFEATKNIRLFNQQVPIIAITANCDWTDSYSSGMNDIIIKPF